MSHSEGYAHGACVEDAHAARRAPGEALDGPKGGEHQREALDGPKGGEHQREALNG
jgi:hypothetical protein